MSELVLDQIKGRSSNTVTDINDLKYKIATAWVSFNGTGTVSIRDSYNVASITDNSTGNYDANFTTNMDNVNYAVTGMMRASTGGGTVRFVDTNAPTVSEFSCNTLNSTGTAVVDAEDVHLHVLGGKS